MACDSRMKNVAVVLVEPKFSENVGAVARLCANFGVDELIVVNPVNFDLDRAYSMATRVGRQILDRMRVLRELDEALGDFGYVVGTTARVSASRKVYRTLPQAAPEISSLALRNRVALLFGNERWGLTNSQLALCHEVITIPTREGSSMNLSHAVAVVLYQLYILEGKVKLPSRPLARVEELKVMFGYLEKACRALGYIPPGDRDDWMANIREMFLRIRLSRREVKMVIGFCKRVIERLQIEKRGF